MRRTLLASCLVLPLSASLLAANPPELFQKAKSEFRLRAYADCLRSLGQLESELERPENQIYRSAVRPGLTFYSGACLAGLDRFEEARDQFSLFLAFQPNTVLDPAIYPKKIIRCLEETRERLAKTGDTVERGENAGETGSMAASYHSFVGSVSQDAEESMEDWSSGPIRHLMTAEDRRDYSRLIDSAARSEFIAAFWKARDPKPETPANELRTEFERRVAFADAHFTQDEVRGSLTDRGMVFVLLGPPTYIGRVPIAAGQDASDPSGMSRYTRADIVAALRTDSRNSAVVYDRMTGPGTKLLDTSANWREVWHYRRDLVPKGVPYQQVDFEFITRKGYGKNVLQRDDAALNTIDAGRRALDGARRTTSN